MAAQLTMVPRLGLESLGSAQDMESGGFLIHMEHDGTAYVESIVLCKC